MDLTTVRGLSLQGPVELLHDLFLMPSGPNMRARLSHGDLDLLPPNERLAAQDRALGQGGAMRGEAPLSASLSRDLSVSPARECSRALCESEQLLMALVICLLARDGGVGLDGDPAAVADCSAFVR